MRKYMHLVLVLLLTAAFATGTVFAWHPTENPWTMYRQNLSRTGSSPSSAPDSNNTLLWTWSHYSLGPPTVADGKVYIAASSGLYALDETTGVIIWGPKYFTGSFYGAPAVVGDRLYIGSTSGYMYCVNATTGLKLWEYQIEASGQIYCSPAVANDKVYFTTTNNYLYAINAITGLHVWRYTVGDQIYYSTPAVDGTWIYFGCDDNKLYAINDTGTLPQKKWDYATSGQIRCTPTVADGKVFFGSPGADHAIFALNKTTGEKIWKFQTSSNYDLTSRVAFSDGILFLGLRSQKAYALRVNVTAGDYSENDPEIQLWSQSVGGNPEDPTVADGKVFLCVGQDLLALSTATGMRQWFYDFGSNAYTTTVADGRLFVNTYDRIACFGEPFPPVTHYYTVTADSQAFTVKLDSTSGTPSPTLDTSGLMDLKIIEYNVTVINGATGASNITIPLALLRGFEGNYVLVNGGLPASGPTKTENSTHTTIYFTYDDGTNTIEIIGTIVLPEYPPTAILPLTLTLTIIALATARKKLKP